MRFKVWTLTVDAADAKTIHTMAFGTEQECTDALPERYSEYVDDPETATMQDYCDGGLVIHIDSHIVEVDGPYAEPEPTFEDREAQAAYDDQWRA